MQRTALLIAVVFLSLCHIGMAWSLQGGQGRSGDDLDRYWAIATSTESASPDGAVEHAPLAPALFKLVRRATGNRDDFRRSLILIMVAADIAIAAALAWGFGWMAAIIYLALATPLLRLFYMRFDLLPTAAVTIGVALYRRGYPVITGAMLAVGTAFKLWPLALSAWFARRWHEPAGRHATLSWLTAGGTVALGWLALDGVEGVEQVVTFRGATGWQVESLGGAAIAARDGLDTLRLESDAWRVGTISPLASVALLSCGTAIALGLGWMAAVHHGIGLAWLSSVLTLLIFAPILSPQYVAWITPAAAIAFTEGHRLQALLAAAAILLTFVVMVGYGGLMAHEDWAVWLIMLRNAMLVVAFAACALAIWRMRVPRQHTASAPTPRVE
jgi:hypothetical protein